MNNRKFSTYMAPVLALGLLLTAPLPAMAKKFVYSPIVEKGEVEFEYYLDAANDSDQAVDGTINHEFEIEYGVTDRWSTAFYYVGKDKPGTGFEDEKLKWENIYQLFEQGERWLDAGLYLEYQAALKENKPDALEFKLLLEKEAGTWLNTANLILKKELGGSAGDSTEFEYAWRTKYRLMPELEFGIEAFGSLGEIANTHSPSKQEHRAGPVIYGKLAGSFEYQAGYLFGLTNEVPDGTFKAQIGYEF